jgi:tRNA(Ile)-lysidine synthase
VSELLQRVRVKIQNRRLLKRGDKILAAVSGGPDSMALLHLLHALAEENRWKIIVAHFNHKLRGRASDADERLVRNAAKRLKLPFVVESADVKQLAARSKLSVEMAARKLRHEFFAGAACEWKISKVALAHHADDQVELFFLRLIRGTGGEGLAGMKWRSPSPAGKSVSLVRPLLGISKRELLDFARANKIQFREDATNFSTDHLRNRIRNELLPFLRKNYQPALNKTVLRLMKIVGAEEEYVGDAARKWLQKSRGSRGNEAQTRSGKQNKPEPSHAGCQNFDDLPSAIQRRVLRLQLSEAGIAADFELIESLRRTPEMFVSAGAVVSVCRRKSGEIKMRSDSAPDFQPDELAVDLSGRNGQSAFAGMILSWRVQTQKPFRLPTRKLAGGPPALRECFDADTVGSKIVLRHWRPGDRFQPIGLKGAAKLQDLFTNAKIPRERRRNLHLAAASSGEIFWVEGLRIGERFKLTPRTARMLVWRWSKLAV